MPGQARIKALREQQRSRLDGRHKYVVNLVAIRLGLTEAAVEEFLLDGDQVLARSQRLCVRGGRPGCGLFSCMLVVCA